MEGITKAAPDANSIRAVLEGGPASIPEAWRTQTVGPHDEKIKIPHRGGYEHFVRSGELRDSSPPKGIVFRWAIRTEIAE